MDLREAAIRMVRYAISPNERDSLAYNFSKGVYLMNLETGFPLSLEDIGIEKELCYGSTSHTDDRWEMVARTTVALWRYYDNNGYDPRSLFK